MKRTASLWLAVASLLFAHPFLQGEERPRYGGTLRVQMREQVFSLDPTDGKDLTLARSRIAVLLFDRLTQIDDHGRVRPQLAASWTSDAQRKTWRFTLRNGVTFHDGSPLTARQVIAAFANDSRWQVRAGNGPQVVVFECPDPIADLPAVLAGARHSIVQRGDPLVGTGPFRIAAWQPGRQLSLAANVDYFDGRPYLDGVEVLMGYSLREQLIDLRLDRDDLVEVDLEQARRLEAATQRVSSSAPGRLLAIVFRSGNPAVRELLSRSLDRDAMHAAILKKSGAPAASLLPQWLSGYALLFSDPRDPARVQKLRSDVSKSSPSLFLAYDPSDPVNKAMADRIAVNARDVGLTVQVFAEKGIGLSTSPQGSRADAVLVSLPLGSASTPQVLAQFADSTQLDQAALLASATPEQLFAAERVMLEGFKAIPVAHLPISVWLSSRVHNWKISPEGRWKLEAVWLESNKSR